MTFDIITEFPYTKSTGYFNSSIIEQNGCRCIFTRKGVWNNDIKLYMSSIWCLKDKQLNEIKLTSKESEQIEDPRAFIYNDKIHFACALFDFEDTSNVKQRVYELDSNLPLDLKVPIQQKWEKNWTYFTDNGRLLCIYSLEPYIIYDALTGELIHRENYNWNWNLGRVCAGSNPVKVDGLFYSFFHSFNMSSVSGRDYYMGFNVFEPTYPYKIIRSSKRPLYIGKKEYGYSEKYNLRNQVVYPAGCVFDDCKFTISVGINDYKTALITIGMDELKKYE